MDEVEKEKTDTGIRQKNTFDYDKKYMSEQAVSMFAAPTLVISGFISERLKDK